MKARSTRNLARGLLPIAQNPDTEFAVVVRTAQAPAGMVPLDGGSDSSGQRAISASSGRPSSRTGSTSPAAYLQRSSARLVGSFAAVALVLGVVGLYGVVAYSASQRTREMGVRIALGAGRSAVYRLILREAGALALLGIGVGLAGAVAAANSCAQLLFDTPPWDVATLVPSPRSSAARRCGQRHPGPAGRVDRSNRRAARRIAARLHPIGRRWGPRR